MPEPEPELDAALARCLAGVETAADRARVEAALAGTEREAVLAQWQVDAGLHALARDPEAWAQQVRDRLTARSSSAAFAAVGARRIRSFQRRRRFGLAAGVLAAAALLLVVSAGWWLKPGADLPQVAGVAVAAGGTIEGPIMVYWRDGTTIDLAASAEVRVGDPAEGKSLSLVSGSLTAEVAKQPPERPFRLTAGTLQLTVVGTRFEVVRLGQGAGLRVAEGQVLAGLAGITVPTPVSAGTCVVSDGVSLTQPTGDTGWSQLRAGILAGTLQPAPWVLDLHFDRDPLPGRDVLGTPWRTLAPARITARDINNLAIMHQGRLPQPWWTNTWVLGTSGEVTIEAIPGASSMAMRMTPTVGSAVQIYTKSFPLAAGRPHQVTFRWRTSPGMANQLGLLLNRRRSQPARLPASTTWRRVVVDLPAQDRASELAFYLGSGPNATGLSCWLTDVEVRERTQ